MKPIFCIAIALLTTIISSAQPNRPQVKAYFDKDSVTIGDQFTLSIEVSKDMMQVIDFPVPEKGQIAQGFEIIQENPIDTLAHDGRAITLRKSYLITVFDPGRYSIAPVPMLYLDKNIRDTIFSADSLRIKVGTFAIDTTTQTIYDITKPLDAPFKAGEISGYLLWALLGAVVVAALVWLYIRYRKKLPLLGKAKVKLPPHIVAITALEAVHNQKLWQNNRHKQYYTAVTDIMREYISERFGFGAMEMTTEEIVLHLKAAETTPKSMDDLKGVLSLSDLVKFAKYIPDGEDNEEVYRKSYYFVEETKPVEVVAERGEKGDE